MIEHCSTCRFWEPIGEASSIDKTVQIGRCYRYPPPLPPDPPDDDQSDWPRTLHIQRCGEWRGSGSVSVPLVTPEELVAQLDSATICERLDQIERERDALKVLLRAALRAEDPARPSAKGESA